MLFGLDNIIDYFEIRRRIKKYSFCSSSDVKRVYRINRILNGRAKKKDIEAEKEAWLSCIRLELIAREIKGKNQNFCIARRHFLWCVHTLTETVYSDLAISIAYANYGIIIGKINKLEDGY